MAKCNRPPLHGRNFSLEEKIQIFIFLEKFGHTFGDACYPCTPSSLQQATKNINFLHRVLALNN